MNSSTTDGRIFFRAMCPTQDGSKRVRLSRRVKPLNSRDKTGANQMSKKNNNVFTVIVNFALVLALPLSPPVTLSTKESVNKMANAFIQMWIFSVNTFRTICFVFVCFYNHLFWSSLANRMGYHVHCLSGFVITWLFIRDRRKIAATLAELHVLSCKLNCKAPDGASSVRLYLCACLLYVSAYFAMQCQYFFVSNWDSITKLIASFVPLASDSPLLSHYNFMVVLSESVSYCTGTLTLFIALFLCGSAYRRSGHLFSAYGRRLLKVIDGRSFGAAVASKNLKLFKRVSSAVKTVDDVFNVCAFFIYVDVINGYFSFISVLLSNDQRFYSFAAISTAVMIMITACVMFFYLTYSGDKVFEQHQALKDVLTKLSLSVMKEPPDVKTFTMFEILAKNIKSREPRVTCLKLFNINKHLVPSITGVIVTYSVMLYQIGANQNS